MDDAEQLWLFDLDAPHADDEDDDELDEDEWTDEDEEAHVALWQAMHDHLQRFNDRLDAEQEPPSGVCRRISVLVP
jgi:hypothetical protein